MTKPIWSYGEIAEKSQDLKTEVEGLLNCINSAIEPTHQHDAEIESCLKRIIREAYRIKNTLKAESVSANKWFFQCEEPSADTTFTPQLEDDIDFLKTSPASGDTGAGHFVHIYGTYIMARPKKKRQKFPDPRPGQHSRLNLDEAIAQYKAKLLTAQGLIYHAVKIYRSNGQKLRITDISSFCQKLGIHRDTFYDSISRLKTSKIPFEWDAIDGIDLWIPDSSELDAEVFVGNSRQKSATPDNNGSTPDNNGSTPDNNGSTPDNNDPANRCAVKVLSDSNQASIYQLFINSLSNSERESFLKFVSEKTAQFNPPLGNINDYLASPDGSGQPRYLEWHRQFLMSPAGREAKQEAIASSHDWRNDPRFEEWLHSSYWEGMPWVQENEAEREQRYAFYLWARKTNAFESIEGASPC